MSAVLPSVLLASLAGSLHCAGMCGPLAAFYAQDDDRGGSSRLPVHAAYHGARLFTYATLGALAGALGAALDLAGRGLGLRGGAGLLAGLVLVLWGAFALLRALGVRLPALPFPRGASAAVSGAIARLRSLPPLRRAVAVGLLTTLLPCGWLHAFVVAAAATGSAPEGAALMAAFWLGTVPALALVGTSAAALLGPLRRHAPAIAAAAVLLMGVLALWRHVPIVTASLSPDAAAAPCHDPAAAPAP